MVVGRALRLAASGIVVGVGAALVLARFLDALLYEAVSPADPTTFVAVSLAAGLLAIVSTWLPARRAAGLEPREALLEE